MALPQGWYYYKTISLTGQPGAGTDYQVDIDIGDSAGGDFHLEGHCTNFPQDIEITSNDGITLLDFSIEDPTVDPIKVWVEVPDDLGSNQEICVYYGKSGATTRSNIEDAFLFGDDFPGASIDTSKWSGNTSSASVAGSILTFSSTGAWKYIFGTNHSAPFACRYYAQMGNSVADNYDSHIGMSNNSISQFAISYSNPHSALAKWNTRENNTVIANATFPIPPNYSYYIGEIKIDSSDVKYYSDGNLDNTEIAQVPQSLNPFVGIRTGDIYVDWIVVRKYNDPEPAFASAGAEQTVLVPVLIRHNPVLTGGMA